MLHWFGLTQHVNTPTRGDNLLDNIVAEDPFAVCGLSVDDAGIVSDHHLMLAKLRARPAPRQPTRYTYRNIKRIDTVAFEDALCRSTLFTALATSTDGDGDHMADILSAELSMVAPQRTSTRRQHKRIFRWLSTAAILSKRERRRLGRCGNGAEKNLTASPIESSVVGRTNS